MAIRIVSLGEFITQDQRKTLGAFAALIKPDNPREVLGKIAELLLSPETQAALDQFKLGLKNEAEFTAQMIAKIKETFGIELTTKDFDKAWNAMNPTFSQFSPLLLEMMHPPVGQYIVLISYTNPKDMNHLVAELRANHIPYTLDPISGELNKIGEQPLFTTYSAKKTKEQLILEIVQGYAPKPVDPSIPSFFPPAPRLDIKYVRGIRGSTDPLVKALSEKSDTGVAATIASLDIETLFWNREVDQPFNEAIMGTEVHIVPAAKL